MLPLNKKMFIELFTSIANASNHIKCVSLNNQQYMVEPALINLYLNDYSQGLCYYPLAINLERCIGSCNVLNDLSNRVCIPNKKEDLNVRVFNITRGISESKTLTKHIM